MKPRFRPEVSSSASIASWMSENATTGLGAKKFHSSPTSNVPVKVNVRPVLSEESARVETTPDTGSCCGELLVIQPSAVHS